MLLAMVGSLYDKLSCGVTVDGKVHFILDCCIEPLGCSGGSVVIDSSSVKIRDFLIELSLACAYLAYTLKLFIKVFFRKIGSTFDALNVHDPAFYGVVLTLLGFQRIIDRERYNVVLNRSRCHLKRSCYQNAPSFAYVIGKYAVSKTGTLTGPSNEALMAALNAKGFIVE